MADAKSLKTVLKVGPVKAPVGLMKATGTGRSQKWETRDPDEDLVNTREEAVEAARLAGVAITPKEEVPEEETPAPAAEEPQGDPLGDDGKVPPPPRSEEDIEAEAKTVEALKAAMKPRKGVLKGDGKFIDLTDEIEAIGERSKTEFMEVVSFIDRGHVPNERIIASYYLAGRSADEEGLIAASPVLKMLHTAMRKANRYMLVRFSKKKGQTLGIVKPQRDGSLLVVELVFAEQWREPGPKALVHNHVEVAEARIEQAAELIDAMAGRRDSIDGIADLRSQMERELADKAKAGEMDEYELAPVDPDADTDTDRLGELLKEAVAEAVA